MNEYTESETVALESMGYTLQGLYYRKNLPSGAFTVVYRKRGYVYISPKNESSGIEFVLFSISTKELLRLESFAEERKATYNLLMRAK